MPLMLLLTKLTSSLQLKLSMIKRTLVTKKETKMDNLLIQTPSKKMMSVIKILMILMDTMELTVLNVGLQAKTQRLK